MFGKRMGGFAMLLLMACLLAPGGARADGIVDLPTVPVVGSTVSSEGLDLVCYTTACVEMTMNLQMMYAEMSIEPTREGGTIPKSTFCANLARARPPGCSYTSPPSVPGFDPGWVGNGCGNGSFVSAIADQLAGKIVAGYSGNLDSPLPGVSFFSACQGHDFCYAASSGTRDSCDNSFKTRLTSICSSSGAAYQSSCGVLAQAYYLAVHVAGASSFNTAQGEKACAGWVHNMKANQCKPLS